PTPTTFSRRSAARFSRLEPRVGPQPPTGFRFRVPLFLSLTPTASSGFLAPNDSESDRGIFRRPRNSRIYTWFPRDIRILMVCWRAATFKLLESGRWEGHDFSRSD